MRRIGPTIKIFVVLAILIGSIIVLDLEFNLSEELGPNSYWGTVLTSIPIEGWGVIGIFGVFVAMKLYDKFFF